MNTSAYACIKWIHTHIYTCMYELIPRGRWFKQNHLMNVVSLANSGASSISQHPEMASYFTFWIPIWANTCSIDARMWHFLHILSFSLVRSKDSNCTIWYRDNNQACAPFLGAVTLKVIPILSNLVFWQQGYCYLFWNSQSKRFCSCILYHLSICLALESSRNYLTKSSTCWMTCKALVNGWPNSDQKWLL